MTGTKKTPVRRCVGCNERKDKKDLIRIIRTPEGRITLDLTGKSNGRGAYLCRDAECLVKARRSHGLERSLGVHIPDEIYDELEREMRAI